MKTFEGLLDSLIEGVHGYNITGGEYCFGEEQDNLLTYFRSVKEKADRWDRIVEAAKKYDNAIEVLSENT